MRFILVLIIFCSFIHNGFTQGISYSPTPNSQDKALGILQAEIIVPENTVLVETNRIKSPFAEHVTFQQITNGLPVRFAEIKLHLRKNGTYNIQNNLFYKKVPAALNFANCYISTDNGVVLAYSLRDEEVEQFTNEAGEVLDVINHIKYYKKDTTLFTKVFAVNPVHSSGSPYGQPFLDRGDSTSTALEDEMVWVSIPVKYNEDTFFLESNYMYFGEIRAPFDSILYEMNDSVVYTRDKASFERMNAYYHINTMAAYVDEMGHQELTDTLKVDVHAGSRDNSGYRPSGHSLEFGDGGVDDAEDGEVVVHEFAHSLSELASPDNTVGSERTAMEEGTADYFCKSYSQTFSSFFRDKVFSWDGHNEFWDGIEINSKKLYPVDLKGDRNSDRDIWSSALMCVQEFIGRKEADSLVLEYLYYQYANSTMSDMALKLLEIDSIDFGGRYHSQLKQCFVDAGFITRGVSVPVVQQSEKLRVLNHSGFSAGTGNLEIETVVDSDFSIFNALGQQVLISSGKRLILNPIDYPSGLYVIEVVSNDVRSSLKIIKQ